MSRLIRSLWFLPILVALAGFSCKQYDYASPTPGILEVRLAAKNTAYLDFIPFGAFDSTTGQASSLFFMILNSIEVEQPGDITQPLFASLVAVRRNPDGDPFNALDLTARDSLALLGIAYVPPGSYTGVNFSGGFANFINVFDPPAINEFPVNFLPPFFTEARLPGAGQPPVDIRVTEGRTTRVTVTFDLDRSLYQRAEWFDFLPVFYISSIQEF